MADIQPSKFRGSCLIVLFPGPGKFRHPHISTFSRVVYSFLQVNFLSLKQEREIDDPGKVCGGYGRGKLTFVKVLWSRSLIFLEGSFR